MVGFEFLPDTKETVKSGVKLSYRFTIATRLVEFLFHEGIVDGKYFEELKKLYVRIYDDGFVDIRNLNFVSSRVKIIHSVFDYVYGVFGSDTLDVFDSDPFIAKHMRIIRTNVNYDAVLLAIGTKPNYNVDALNYGIRLYDTYAFVNSVVGDDFSDPRDVDERLLRINDKITDMMKESNLDFNEENVNRLDEISDQLSDIFGDLWEG